MNNEARAFLITGTFILFLAVLFGAFGAHGLEKNIDNVKLLKTFQTGVRYQFYHGFGLLFVGIFQQQYKSINFKPILILFLTGIILFSFNCYLYTLTEIKTFAMIVPVGGVAFIIGWLGLFMKFIKFKEVK